MHTDTAEQPDILAEGNHVRLLRSGGWEYVERTNGFGVVVIVAVTDESKLLLVEQYRPPVKNPVIELPAGLAGDCANYEREGLVDAAQRELLEETGYMAGEMILLTAGPTSAGLTTEQISIFRAVRLRKTQKGGGDHGERITVHEVPLADVNSWLRSRQAAGSLVDPKLYIALYFATV